ncbi:MAG: hypothetical protein O3B95_12030, partial [Chloroflexi bacterium]|nr:hypothetical protein [Chloroflexota bacterium]
IEQKETAIAQYWRTPGRDGIMSLKGVLDEQNESLWQIHGRPLSATARGDPGGTESGLDRMQPFTCNPIQPQHILRARLAFVPAATVTLTFSEQ